MTERKNRSLAPFEYYLRTGHIDASDGHRNWSHRPFAMKTGHGCLAMLLAMAAGYGIGFYLNDRFLPFIGQAEAVRSGHEIALIHCRELDVPFPVKCGAMRLTEVTETVTGWFMTFASDDNLLRDSMLIRRRGSYDATNRAVTDPRTGAEYEEPEARQT